MLIEREICAMVIRKVPIYKNALILIDTQYIYVFLIYPPIGFLIFKTELFVKSHVKYYFVLFRYILFEVYYITLFLFFYEQFYYLMNYLQISRYLQKHFYISFIY